MEDNRGFTFIEVLIYSIITSSILLVLFTTIGFTKGAWRELAEESEQSYGLRTISAFLYREVRTIDKDKPITITNNGTRGNRITYHPLNSSERRTIEVATNVNRLYCRIVGGATLILAENINYIEFTLDGELLKVVFRVSGKEYQLVIPWD